ncbi:Hpt domain-containing protein [uncultured Aliiroseovarius sp.]|uniref:Hpt domain-containing protein n=1 Tax=uncultured Aliiroseovarius sp. TaxID=1658783 RepID=UPI0026356E94|nr:Hpt domain-containing protein [uncultured Aliiroseovarius sp.]
MIDWNRVTELKDEIGEDDFAIVAEMFLEEVEEVIDRLKANPKPALFEQDMHFLKSSALNLGFKALTALCAVGEREAAAGNFEAVPLAPLFKTYDASKAEFVARA